jgi:hypothetical protein
VKFPTTLYHRCSSLSEKLASKASDLDIWTAAAQLVVAFDSLKGPPTPKTPPKDNSPDTKGISPVLRKSLEKWTSYYLPESLEALQHTIRENERRGCLDEEFYAKTLIFLQSSGMGKSRLADAFGKECPMINFVLREKGRLGYPPADSEVLSFMRKKLKSIAAESSRPEEVMVTTAWNHSVAVGLLQASFELCKLRPLFITTKAQVLIQNSQCVG